MPRITKQQPGLGGVLFVIAAFVLTLLPSIAFLIGLKGDHAFVLVWPVVFALLAVLAGRWRTPRIVAVLALVPVCAMVFSIGLFYWPALICMVIGASWTRWSDPTVLLPTSERFISRVDDYVKYRPDYPAAALELLARELDLREGRRVADIGAGTGLLTRDLLLTGATVVAVDPNEDMLAAAREFLRKFDRASFLVGRAEATGLEAGSIDAVTMAQTFHWVDQLETRTELQRVLAPDGRVALVWNTKAFGESEFLEQYERLLLAYAPEFAEVRSETVSDEDLRGFFAGGHELHEFSHEQQFDLDGVIGRVMSASYAPKDGERGHDELVAGLTELFGKHAEDGTVRWPYLTKVYVGTLG